MPARELKLKRIDYILIGIGTTAVVALVIVVWAGGVDQLSNDGGASKKAALFSLGFYWLLGIVSVLAWRYRAQYWKQFLLAIGSALVTCACLELILRVSCPPLALPEFHHLRSANQHHVLEPNKSSHLGYFEGNHVLVQTNEDGLRSNYSRKEFCALKTRIVCLGDSFTFGAWVKAEDSYPEVLQRRLRSKTGKSSIGVLNAGILSYSPLLEEKMLDHVARHYKPQIVMLMLDCTDIGDDHDYGSQYHPERLTPGPFNGPTLSKPHPHYGALWRLLKPCQQPVTAPFRLLSRLTRSHQPFDPLDYNKLNLVINGTLETERFFIYRHPLDLTRPFFDASWENIRRIAQRCEEIDAQFVLLVSPRYHHWNEQECPENWEAFAYDLNEPYQYAFFEYFDEQAKTAGFPVYNLLNDFQQTKKFPLVFRTDPHWNPRGHEFVADLLVKLLLDKLPQAPPKIP